MKQSDRLGKPVGARVGGMTSATGMNCTHGTSHCSTYTLHFIASSVMDTRNYSSSRQPYHLPPHNIVSDLKHVYNSSPVV